MKNKKILILEGGLNEEHNISLETSKQIQNSLLNLKIKFETLEVNPLTFKNDICKFDEKYICFNALHGSFGEDGQIQKILDKMQIKYTHSSAKASYLGFNKSITKEEIKNSKINYPKSINIKSDKINKKFFKEMLIELNQFINKPNSSGSSFGIQIFKTDKDIEKFFENYNENILLYKNHHDILIEKYLDGRELTVSVYQKKNISIPLEVTEVISHNKKFFDFQSKYTPGFSKHILPANLNKNIYNKCKDYAKFIHDKLQCSGVSRTDFILVGEKIFFLEINTQPGLTPLSLVPEQLAYQDISFDEFILNMLTNL
jgi:D-alanine-D-alanine ligase